MDLLRKKSSLLVRAVYCSALFIAVFTGIFYLYGYLWNTIGRTITRSTARGLYLEAVQAACTNDEQCVGRCGPEALGAADACLCLRDSCYRVTNAQEFSSHKFCDSDEECTVSCYEGPVAKSYYNSVGGVTNDCADGCMAIAYLRIDHTANPPVCRNHQCQYRNGETCFQQNLKEDE